MKITTIQKIVLGSLVVLPLLVTGANRDIATSHPSSTSCSNSPVFIDAGHGGHDPGAIGLDKLKEKDIVLPISLDVVEGLRKQGVEARMTRNGDYFRSLPERTNSANNNNACLFVSIHANAFNLSHPEINGLETYYYEHGHGRRLAEFIHRSILNSVKIKDRGIKKSRFYVLKNSSMPAVLVEVGFVTGAEDAPRLKNPTHRRKIADAIILGILQELEAKAKKAVINANS